MTPGVPCKSLKDMPATRHLVVNWCSESGRKSTDVFAVAYLASLDTGEIVKKGHPLAVAVSLLWWAEKTNKLEMLDIQLKKWNESKDAKIV